jgi:hypothetical protein
MNSVPTMLGIKTAWDDMPLTRYILIKETLPVGHAILAVAHSSLSGYLTCVEAERATWEQRDKDVACARKTVTEIWAETSFKERLCMVSEAEFEKAKEYGENMKDYRVMTESSLGNMETAIVFKPREEWPKFFKFLRLYK